MEYKITKEFLNKKYDELYKKTCDLQDKYNPCGVKRGVVSCTCIAGRKGQNVYKANLKDSFCCLNCRYLGPKGCSVEALRCKLWFCGFIYEQGLDPEFKKELDALVAEAWSYGFFVFRGGKEDNLYEAYYKFGILRSMLTLFGG